MPKVGSNRFDLSHDVKMSFRMGQLVPTCVIDCVPGDKFRISVENMLRFAPLIAPVMHRVNVTTHYFFIPNRLLWSGWSEWITGQSEVQAPYVDLNDYTVGVGYLMDYLSYPTIFGGSLLASPFAMAAYALVYDEYYRDQNLQAERFIPLTAGNNTSAYEALFQSNCFSRAWMHDYFTSCLPFAQKGDPVVLPLVNGDSVPVELRPVGTGFLGTLARHTEDGDPVSVAAGLFTASDGQVTDSVSDTLTFDPQGDLIVNLNSEAATINTLRRAFRLQEWLERNARGGTRYIEHIMAHFGVRSSDARLQRPEYIGGAYQRMSISEVLSTAQTLDVDDNTTPVGYMAGHGISVGSGQTFDYSCEEHGIILGIINVQPVTAYQQGIPRMHTRFDPLDYFWPSFANIGEQEVKVKELYTDTTPENMEETFGYIPRYSEYRYLNSRVHGSFKDTLSFWHMGRIFGGVPVLNSSFITADPTDRCFAVQDGNDNIWAHVFNNISAVRKMPVYGTPSF